MDNQPWLIPKAWTVNEKIGTFFVQGNIDTTWGEGPFRGNVGVQVQHTDQSSDSRVWDNSQAAGHEIRPFTNGKTYTDVLPSLNLAFSLTNDQTLRVALARQVARARVDQLRASVEFGVDTATAVSYTHLDVYKRQQLYRSICRPQARLLDWLFALRYTCARAAGGAV